MVSMGPNSHSRLYFHMSDFKDLRSNSKTIKVTENSMLDILNKTEEFSKFRELVHHSQYESKLNDCNVTTTLFVPINEAFPDNFMDELDRQQANMYILSNMLEDRVIPSELLEHSPCSIFPTKFTTPNYITVKNINGSTYINDCKVIIKDIITKNGIIHIVDSLNIPKYYI
jgi:transforming growth factor-beta-induced protein